MKPDPASGLVWQHLVWPRPLEPALAVQLLRQWAADQRLGLLALEVRATKTGTCYLVGASPSAAAPLAASLRHLVPGALMSPEIRRPPVQRAARLRVSTAHRALRADAPEDVARAVLSALAAVRDRDEELVLQLVLGARRRPQAVPNNSSSAAILPWWRAAWSGTTSPLDSERRTALRNKVGQPGFALTIRVGVRAVHPDCQRSLIFGVLAGLRTAQASGIALRLQPERPARLNEARWPWFGLLSLNVLELLGLTAWPLGDDPLPGLPSRHPRQLPADERLRDRSRIVAMGTAPGATRPLGLSATDALQHAHVLGPTGTGKSTLLLNLITSDMAAEHGVIVIDPKGDLATDVLARVPANRRDDVVVLDPSDPAPLGLNPLSTANSSPELVVDGLMSVFRSLYGDALGPRTTDVLHASLLTLARRGDTSLLHVPLLLTNPGFRRSITATVRDPIGLAPFWAAFEALSDAERATVIAPLMNKIRPVLLRPAMRAVLGQVRPKFSLTEVFTDNKILIVNLAKGLLGQETAALLGSLVVAQIWQAVLARTSVPAAQRRPVSIYLDEFQDFLRLPTNLADALAQARGLGAGFTLAHQYLAQLTPAMRAAVMANARSRICFQLSPDDAIVMARLHPRLEAEDFRALNRYEVYASLVADGQVTSFASGRTQAPPTPTSRPADLRQLVRDRYGATLSDVEAGWADLAQGPHGGQDGVQRRPRRSP